MIGAPLLTVTYNSASDDCSTPPLSVQDQYLLEQIDKGQLKLSPCHQVMELEFPIQILQCYVGLYLNSETICCLLAALLFEREIGSSIRIPSERPSSTPEFSSH